MNIFHIFAVTPFDVAPCELPQVQYLDYFVQADTLVDAYNGIKDSSYPGWYIVENAAEVYGALLQEPECGKARVLCHPLSAINKKEDKGKHLHWAANQDGYELLHRGPESLDHWSDRKFAERHPGWA